MVASDEHIARNQATVGIVVRAVSLAIVQPLGIRRGWIDFPQTTGKRDDVERGFQRLGRIPGVIGCVDGTMIAIVGPSQNDPTVTKAACDADCRVMSIDPRYPGSMHDSFAWRYSWLRSNFEQGRLIDDGRVFLGDSGYALEPWLITFVPRFHTTSTACGHFNKAHSSIRSVVECCIGLSKSRFQCLQRHRTLYYHPTTATVITSACAVLHNICLSSRELEPEPDCDPDEPGLESGPSSEGSVADDERLAPAHPRVSLSDRGRALRQRLVAQFRTRHSRASLEPHASHVAVAPTRDTTSAKESVATTEVPPIRDAIGDSEPLVVLTSTDTLATREASPPPPPPGPPWQYVLQLLLHSHGRP
ncbi:hypothetical protein ISCGN_002200 [Ixodes scapularis]